MLRGRGRAGFAVVGLLLAQGPMSSTAAHAGLAMVQNATGAKASPMRSMAFPGLVLRDDTRRTITAWLDGDGARAEGGAGVFAPKIRPLFGKLVVRNVSGITADVYLTLDDGVSDFAFVAHLPTGYRLTVRRLSRRVAYLLAAEDTNLYDGLWNWGPSSFVILRRRFVTTLLP